MSDEVVSTIPARTTFAVIVRSYLATGRASVGKVGGATSKLIEAGDVVEYGVAWMAENLSRPSATDP
ncbi:MAG: AAC(3) family N-acetyltransferase [Actinomycetota bacterium]|nr:AAC(3) family N-acetyltransferase [Actinomycetota bacterium]